VERAAINGRTFSVTIQCEEGDAVTVVVVARTWPCGRAYSDCRRSIPRRHVTQLSRENDGDVAATHHCRHCTIRITAAAVVVVIIGVRIRVRALCGRSRTHSAAAKPAARFRRHTPALDHGEEALNIVPRPGAPATTRAVALDLWR